MYSRINFEIFIVGGVPSIGGFVGCMKEIVIEGLKINPLGWRLNEVNIDCDNFFHLLELKHMC